MHSLDIVYPKVSKFYNELHTSLASCGVNGFKVDLGLGYGDKVSLFPGCHQDGVTFPSMFENSALTWRFLGGKPKLMFLEGLLATLMEANMYFEAFTPINGGDNCGINDGFHSPVDHNFYKKLCLKSRALRTYCLDDEEWNVRLLATTLSDLYFQERITSCKKQYVTSFSNEPHELYQCVLGSKLLLAKHYVILSLYYMSRNGAPRQQLYNETKVAGEGSSQRKDKNYILRSRPCVSNYPEFVFQQRVIPRSLSLLGLIHLEDLMVWPTCLKGDKINVTISVH